MQAHFRDTRKIDPTRGDKLGDGTPNDANRIEIDPTQSAFGEWQAAELTLPNLAAMREHRWKRLTQHVVDRDYGALLVFDPLNIRYASDTPTCSCGTPTTRFAPCCYAPMATWCCGTIKTRHFWPITTR